MAARTTWDHKNEVVPGFTSRDGVGRLVWFECHESIMSARLREKQIKEWRRDWKIAPIEQGNPRWIDLYPCLSL